MSTEVIYAPWSADQVKTLNRFQSTVHLAFACGGACRMDMSLATPPVLVATESGWTCPGCDYTQNWAHAFMADADFLDELGKMFR